MSTSILTRRVFGCIGATIVLLSCRGVSLAGTEPATQIPSSVTNPPVSVTNTFPAEPATAIPPTVTSTATAIGVIDTYPQIDGQVRENEWENISLKYSLHHGGMMHYVNDDHYLYVLIDVVEDTGDDAPLKTDPWGDFFNISFDLGTIGKIDANKDIDYGLYPGKYTAGFQYYLGPDEWTGLYTTRSKFAAGFGSSFNSSTPHRIWEFAFDLNEIQASPGGTVYIGVRTRSQTPSFDDSTPDRFAGDFSKLIPLSLR